MLELPGLVANAMRPFKGFTWAERRLWDDVAVLLMRLLGKATAMLELCSMNSTLHDQDGPISYECAMLLCMLSAEG